MTICKECNTVEGGWREPTVTEAQEIGMDYYDGSDVSTEDLICTACDSFGSYRMIPEYEDVER